ncbi:DMT family transporter [Heyndrickxia acidiproducens]|uniref:DMT family transporter n=1 Tax=Heyndrickxia acidiproducens TaxID=1121084 RepID=UPI0003800DFC|nr:DMT family transporter [Heyndrickxia acidiproducens]
MKSNMAGAIYLALAASIWGGMYVVSKYVLYFVPPLTLLWFRYLIGFSVLYFILNIQGRKQEKPASGRIRKKDWLLLAWIGFVGYFASIALQFIGTKAADAHTGAIITSASPVFIVIFARMLLHEKLTVQKVFSLILASIGVVIVIGWDIHVQTYFRGSLILAGAMITWALLSVYVKLASETMSSLVITTYGIMFGLLFTTPFMVMEVQEAAVTLNSIWVILGILYLGIVSTAGAFFLWNKGLEIMEAGSGSLFLFLQPVVGSFLGWLLLHENLNNRFFLGGSLILIAIAVSIIAEPARRNAVAHLESLQKKHAKGNLPK